MARNPIVFQNGTLVSNAKVEVGGTVYDVTPAQYEGTTPLSANNLNQMQTNIYDYVDEEIEGITEVYSTTETLTNKIWDNGKPIYRKVFRGKLTGGEGNTQSIAHGISNVDEFVLKEGFVNSSMGGQQYPLPMYYSSTNYTVLRLSETYIYLNSTPTHFTNQPFRLILEYTKTTD